MRLTLWTAVLLLLVAVFLVGCAAETKQVSDKAEKSSSTTHVKETSSTTQAPKKVAEEKPDTTTTSLPKQTFTIIDEKEGGVTGTDVQRFEATILVTDKSDSALIALGERLESHYSEHLGTHRQVDFYFFDDKTPASRYLHVSDDESFELDKLMVASYHLDKESGPVVLLRYEDGKSRILKDSSK